MPYTESDHRRGVAAAVSRLDLAAPATSSSSCAAASATARDEDEFTFAAVAVAVADCAFPDARIGPAVYPVFGRPRWSPPPKEQQQQQQEDKKDGPAGAAGTATDTVRVPLERILIEEPSCDYADAELDGVPAETYSVWSPRVSPPASAGSSRRASPARCLTSGSVGSSVLRRWRRRRRRRRVDVEPSHSDDEDRFVSLGTSSDRVGGGEERGWMNRGSAGAGGKSSSTPFLRCKQDLVGLVVSAVTCRRSCYPF